jgi:hypothetical protein
MTESDARNLLRARKQAIEETVAANRGHACDPATRFILDGLTARLARLLLALDRDLARPLVGGPFGTAGAWGRNGRAPEIDDLIRRSARQRRPMPEARSRASPAGGQTRRMTPSPTRKEVS